MNDFTYFEILTLVDIVMKEEYKIRKELERIVCKNFGKIFRPGLFRRLQHLIEIEKKLNALGEALREQEEKQQGS